MEAERKGSLRSTLDIAIPTRYAYLAELDKQLWFKRYNEDAPFTEILDEALGMSSRIMNARGIRHTLYVKEAAKNTTVVLHLMNKNLPLNTTDEERVLQRIPQVQVNVPKPAKMNGTPTVTAYVPGAAPVALTISEDATHIHFRLEDLGAYAVVMMEYKHWK